MNNPFFKNKGPFKINKLLKLSGIKNLNTFEKDMIKNVNDLNNAKNNEIKDVQILGSNFPSVIHSIKFDSFLHGAELKSYEFNFKSNRYKN